MRLNMNLIRNKLIILTFLFMISGTTVHADINVNGMRSTEISSDAESLSDDDLEYEAIKDELSNLSYADIKEGMAEAKKLDIKLEKVQPEKKNIPEILKRFVSGFLKDMKSLLKKNLLYIVILFVLYIAYRCVKQKGGNDAGKKDQS